VVEKELAADDHQTLDPDLQPPASASASELGDVVASGAERRRGEGMDAQAQALDAHPGEDEPVAAQGCEARPDAGDRNLEEGRRVGGGPAHPEPVDLELRGGHPHRERFDPDRSVEHAREGVLDEPSAPLRRAPQGVERGRARHEGKEEELAPPGHGGS